MLKQILKTYTCPTCGYEGAVWKLEVNTMHSQLCENCYPKYSNRYSRIISFKLNCKVIKRKSGRKARHEKKA